MNVKFNLNNTSSFSGSTLKKYFTIQENGLMLILLAGAILTTFAVYFKVLDFGFVLSWDDKEYVIENPHIQMLSFQNLKSIFSSFYVANYQPVTMLVYTLEYIFSNGNPFVFHAVNIFIHLLNSWLVYILIRKLSPQNSVVALITAAFFAIHPMHIESVAWISELKDVLYSFFFLLGLILYCQFLNRKQTMYLILTFLFFVLSCLSKSAAVIFPLILLLFDFYFFRQFSLKTLIEKLPFFIVSLIIGIVAIHSQKETIQGMAPTMTIIEHICIVSFSFMMYIAKLVVPVDLSTIYAYPVEVGHSLLPFYYYLAIPFVLGLFVFVWYSQRWGRTFIFGFLFFVVSIILVLQLVPVGVATMADRYSYIPFIGLIFIVAKGHEQLLSSPKLIAYKVPAIISLWLFFVSFTVIANERTKVWKDDDKLFSDVINKYPNNYMAYINRGYYRGENNDIKRAIIDMDKAISINPNQSGGYENRGSLKQSIGHLHAALNDYSKAIQLNPSNDLILNNMGSIKQELNDIKGAMFYYNKAIEINPTKGYLAYYNRGAIRYRLNDLKGALNDYNEALNIFPDFFDAILNRVIIYKKLNLLQQALVDYNKLIELNPKYIIAYHDRAVLKQQLNDMQGSIFDLDKMIQFEPNKADNYNLRGLANFNLGYTKEALSDFDKAIELDKNFYKAYHNRAITKQSIKDFSGSISDFSKAIAIYPAYFSAYNNRGFAKSVLKDYSAAINDYNKAIEINPNFPDAYNNRGVAYFNLKKYRAAYIDWCKAIQLKPDFIQAAKNKDAVEKILSENAN